MAAKESNIEKPVFDIESFKAFVNTYDPKLHGGNDPRTIIHDMLYGIGISINKEKYSDGSGYRKFKEVLNTIITSPNS